MKTNRLRLCAMAFGLAAFSRVLGADPLDTAPAPTPTPSISAIASAQWTDLKGYNFDMREELMSGLKALEARVDEQISELAAKRAAMVDSNVSTVAWDLVMQEMSMARTALKSAVTDLAKAPRETWDQMKDRVGEAWTRTQDAYAKVKASTTN